MLQFLLKLICLSVSMSAFLMAADLDAYFRSLNHSGREFWFTFPPISDNPSDTASVRVLLLSSTKQSVVVEIPGRGFFERVEMEPYITKEVPIPGIMAQPYTIVGGVGSPADTVWQGAAVHVYADDPVVVQGQSYVRYNGEVFAVLPVHVLGQQYGISSYNENSSMTQKYSPSDVCIVAVEDSTEVSFTVSGHAETLTTGGVGSNGVIQAVLDRGDVLTISTKLDKSDLSGSLIESSKPIAVLAGVQSGNVPLVLRWFNALIEMQRPISMWGKKYHVAKLPQRERHSYVRAYAVFDSTKLWKDDVPQDELHSIPLRHRYNFFNDRISNGEENGLLIESSAPMYVSQFNTAIEDGQNQNLESFQMDLVPVELYDTLGIFALPSYEHFGVPSESDSFVSIIYNSPDSEIPNHLEFAHDYAGSLNWKPVKDLFHNKHGKPVGTEGNWWVVNFSVHEEDMIALRCENSFYAYTYGYGAYASHGSAPTGKTTWINISDSVGPGIRVVSRDRSTISIEAYDEGEAGVAIVNLENVDEGFKLSRYNMDLTRGVISCVVEFPVGMVQDTAVLLVVDRAGNESRIELFQERCYGGTNSIPEFGQFVETDPVTLNEPGVHSVLMTNQSDSSIVFTNLKTSNSEGHVLTTTSVVLPASSILELQIATTPQEKKGVLKTTLYATDACDREHVLADMQTRVIGGDLEYPSMFVFPPTPYLSIIERDVTIANVSMVDITIFDLEFSSERGQIQLLFDVEKLPITLKANEYLSLPLRFFAGLPFRAKGTIELTTDSNLPKVVIDLDGEVVLGTNEELTMQGVSLHIAPHPVVGENSSLFIQSDSYLECSVQFFDSRGHHISSKLDLLVTGVLKVDLPQHLTAGMYLVSLTIEDKQYVVPFIVKH